MAANSNVPAFKRPKDTSLVTVAGNFGDVNPLRQNMQFQGRWQQHQKFGLQLACSESRLLEDDPAHRALSEITCHIKGIGQVKAEALMKAFGADLVKVRCSVVCLLHCPSHNMAQVNWRTQLPQSSVADHG